MDYVNLIEYPDVGFWGLLVGAVITLALFACAWPGKRVNVTTIPIQGIVYSWPSKLKDYDQPVYCPAERAKRGSFLLLPAQARSRLFRGQAPELDESLATTKEVQASIADFERAVVFYRLALRASKQTVTPQPKIQSRCDSQGYCWSPPSQ